MSFKYQICRNKRKWEAPNVGELLGYVTDYENSLIDVPRLLSLNWHKPCETRRSSRLGAPEGLIIGDLERERWICLGKVAEGETFPSHWQGIGSLRKRPVKLILTKPPGNEWSAYATVFITDAITRGWARFSDGGRTYKANVKSLRETSPLQRDYPRTGTIT